MEAFYGCFGTSIEETACLGAGELQSVEQTEIWGWGKFTRAQGTAQKQKTLHIFLSFFFFFFLQLTFRVQSTLPLEMGIFIS